MTQATFIFSTGRCSTQYLTNLIAENTTNTVVEHEPLGGGYMSRHVFYSPNRFEEISKKHSDISSKFDEIQRLLKRGISYVSTGWPVYAWLPYLASRFGENFKFIIIVREPFDFAASMLSHKFFRGLRSDHQNHSVIHGHGNRVLFSELAKEWYSFTPYEKCLFHWLEVNTFLYKHTHTKGYGGLFKFEDLYSAQGHVLTLLRDHFNVMPGSRATKPLDRFNRPCFGEISANNGSLLTSVVELSNLLGYNLSAQNISENLRQTRLRYSEKRIS